MKISYIEKADNNENATDFTSTILNTPIESIPGLFGEIDQTNQVQALQSANQDAIFQSANQNQVQGLQSANQDPIFQSANPDPLFQSANQDLMFQPANMVASDQDFFNQVPLGNDEYDFLNEGIGQEQVKYVAVPSSEYELHTEFQYQEINQLSGDMQKISM